MADAQHFWNWFITHRSRLEHVEELYDDASEALLAEVLRELHTVEEV